MGLSGSISEQAAVPTEAEIPAQTLTFKGRDAPPMPEHVIDGGRPPDGSGQRVDGNGQAEEGERPRIDAMAFANLSRAQKEARRATAEAKAERMAVQQEREALAAERARGEATSASKLDMMRRDPAAYINEFGLDHYNAVSQVIAQGGYTPEQMQQRQLATTQAMLREQAERQAALEKRTEERLAAQEASSKAARQQEAQQLEQAAVQEFMGDIQEFVNTEPGFRLIAKAGPNAIRAVYQEIDQHYERTRGAEKLPMRVAAERVRDRLEQEAREYLEDPEIGQRLGYRGAPVPRAVPRQLNNSMGPVPAPRPQRPESEAERQARVISEIQRARSNHR